MTIEEHSEAHRLLYEKHGAWQDRVAWQTLSGQISHAEAIKQAQSLANSGDNNPMRRCPGAKEKMAAKKKGYKFGPCSEERKRKIGEKAKGNDRGRMSKGISRGKGVPKSELSVKKRIDTLKSNPSAIESLKKNMISNRISHKGTIWINDGTKNKHHSKGQPIPEGFKRGKITYERN